MIKINQNQLNSDKKIIKTNYTKEQKKKKKKNFTLKIPLKNYKWWIISFFLILIVIGIVRSWIIPNSHFLDPIIWLINLLLGIFGISLISIYSPGVGPNFQEMIKGIADGIYLTIMMSVISVVFGFFLAALLAVILVEGDRTRKKRTETRGIKTTINWIVSQLAQFYVNFFRSTPLMVQILLVYFGFLTPMSAISDSINASWFDPDEILGTLALTLNTAAYQAEIIRSGILAIPAGQTEAARALGLTQSQTMKEVILPQAFRIIIPPLTNEAINVLLNSSLVSAISVLEITLRSKHFQSETFQWWVFLIAAFYYFVIAFSLSKLTKRLEIKMHIPGLGVQND
ncbi:amino acid ABC transporter permease [Candidatus Harpocratesius sp.]